MTLTLLLSWIILLGIQTVEPEINLSTARKSFSKIYDLFYGTIEALFTSLEEE